MKPEALREMTLEQLKKILMDTLREQFNLRMLRGSGQSVKTHSFANNRRLIARVKTVLAQKEAKP